MNSITPASAPVLIIAAVLSFPALWDAFVAETTPLSVGLTRFLIAIVVCWLALAALTALVGPPPKKEKPESDAEEETASSDNESVTSA